MDLFVVFGSTVQPYRIIIMPRSGAPHYVDVDPEEDLKLIHHLMVSMEFEVIARGQFREMALEWQGVYL